MGPISFSLTQTISLRKPLKEIPAIPSNRRCIIADNLDLSSIDKLGGSNQLNKGLGAKILELRSQGSSYRDIESKLGCSKGSVSYHCGSGQKEKALNNQRKGRKSDILRTKVQRFQEPEKLFEGYEPNTKKLEKTLQKKIIGFSMSSNKKGSKCKTLFKVKDLIEKMGTNPTCYLTGRPINMEDGRSYHLDHIVPRSRGGTNYIENCGIACKEANQAKNNLTLDEFVKLCKEVIRKNKSN